VAIKDWPEDDRPREKLLKHGAARLSDAELLALFLRTGMPGRSALDLGRELCGRFGSVSALLAADFGELIALAGLGQAKATQLMAVLELARRALQEQLKAGVNLGSPQAVREYLRLSLRYPDKEVFLGVFLDAQNRVVATEELSHGTLTQTSVFPREVVRRALHYNAAAVIFAHNHPSGLAEPSRADEVLTQALKQALALVDVKVLDHFIVGGNAALSFAERGLL
jgi:DNA repair protein RadC